MDFANCAGQPGKVPSQTPSTQRPLGKISDSFLPSCVVASGMSLVSRLATEIKFKIGDRGPKASFPLRWKLRILALKKMPASIA